MGVVFGVAVAGYEGENRTARLQAAGTGRNHLPFNEAEERTVVSVYRVSNVSASFAWRELEGEESARGM